ncbi:hypothetical protein QSH57_010083 [Fusarium oxysporum f. sp. vasinfectum]|nr:hypothetical protein QSH57_010083 [Fusarium oxysporum f. sp. vasinfectum]
MLADAAGDRKFPIRFLLNRGSSLIYVKEYCSNMFPKWLDGVLLQFVELIQVNDTSTYGDILNEVDRVECIREPKSILFGLKCPVLPK